MAPLSESDFESIADRTLRNLLEALSDTEDDRLDADLESGVLTITFEDDSKYVINSHRAARQIWMSADASAWHFNRHEQHWRSTKTNEELWTLVEERVGNKLGKPLQLQRPSP